MPTHLGKVVVLFANTRFPDGFLWTIKHSWKLCLRSYGQGSDSNTLNSSVVIIPSWLRVGVGEREKNLRNVKSCFESTCSSFVSKRADEKILLCGALNCISGNWKAMLLHHNSEKSVCCQHFIQTKWCGNIVIFLILFGVFLVSIRTLSKSAKSESSSHRLLMMCWNSASLAGLQSPLPSIMVARKAVGIGGDDDSGCLRERGRKVHESRLKIYCTFHRTYPCNRNPFGRGIHCYQYLRVKTKRWMKRRISHSYEHGEGKK